MRLHTRSSLAIPKCFVRPKVNPTDRPHTSKKIIGVANSIPTGQLYFTEFLKSFHANYANFVHKCQICDPRLWIFFLYAAKLLSELLPNVIINTFNKYNEDRYPDFPSCCWSTVSVTLLSSYHRGRSSTFVHGHQVIDGSTKEYTLIIYQQSIKLNCCEKDPFSININFSY